MKRSLLLQVGDADGGAFEALVRDVVLAEELGFDTVWCFPSVAEDGTFRGNAPEIWLAGLAQRTERIRLGWGIGELLPPSYPPMRTAEQAATLDLASDGRLDVAVLPGDDLDAGDEDWQEGYRMLVDMWDEPTFSWTSTRFEVRPIDVVPKPLQKPHPPIRLAGWSEEHARAAGRGGLGFLDLSGASASVIEAHRDAYSEGRGEVRPEDLVSVDAFALAAEVSPDEAGAERLASLEALGLDELVLPLLPPGEGGGPNESRIRFLATRDPNLH